MPNHISTYVSMEGNEKEIEQLFKKVFTKGRFDFNKIIPEPKTKKECPEQYICNPKKECIEPRKGKNWFNWYRWSYDNWGTKWNSYDNQKYSNYEFLFYSAWCTPLPVLIELSKMFPNITFNFDIDGEIEEPYYFTLKNGKRI